jgi:hypothetical protein
MDMLERSGWSVVALVLLPVLAAGCQAFDPALLPVKPAVDPGQDGGPDNACPNGSKRPPERPTTADSNSIEPLVFALKDPVMSNANAALNVDRVCTSQTGLWTCLPPPELARYLEGEVPVVPPDGPLGEENQFAREIFPLVSNILRTQGEGALDVTLKVSLGSGTYSPLIRISEYNGTANDPRVTVVISQAVFSLAGQAGATMPPPVCIEEDPERGGVPHFPHVDDVVDDNNPALTECFGEEIPNLPVEQEYDGNGDAIAVTGYDPAWEEGRVWSWARHDAYRDRMLGSPLVVDDVAYVSDWMVVARLPDNTELKIGAVRAKFTDAFAMAKLKEDLSGTEPDEVLVAGRWSVLSMLENAESVGVCPGTVPYNLVRTQLETHIDVRSNRDQEGEDVPCDAFSFGITMTGHRAQIGGITLGQPTPNACQ